MNVKVSVIIVSYNSEKFINKCVSLVIKNLSGSQIIVFDNASSDKTLDNLKTFLPKIKLVESSENLGFSKANNKAAKEALGDYLFFLNPDTEVEKPILDNLLDFYESRSDIGVVGPKLVTPSGEVQPSAVALPTIWGAIREFIFGIKGSYLPFIPLDGKQIEVECVVGAAMLIKKDLFWQVEGFNEKFFLYYEDIDFCRKIGKLGKKIFYDSTVSITHLVGGAKSIGKYEHNLESSRRYHGPLKFIILQAIFRLHRILKLGYN